MWLHETYVEVTIQMPQKCSHQSQIERMLWVHFKCVLYAITMKSLGSFNKSPQYSQHIITGFRSPCPQCLDPSYTTPLSTGGCSSPLTCCPSCSPTPEGSDLENNAHLQMELVEAWVEAFLVGVEEDLELNNLSLLENVEPMSIPVLVIDRSVPFVVSTKTHIPSGHMVSRL